VLGRGSGGRRRLPGRRASERRGGARGLGGGTGWWSAGLASGRGRLLLLRNLEVLETGNGEAPASGNLAAATSRRRLER
jgi:hypothetical protein